METPMDTPMEEAVTLSQPDPSKRKLRELIDVQLQQLRDAKNRAETWKNIAKERAKQIQKLERIQRQLIERMAHAGLTVDPVILVEERDDEPGAV